MIHTTYQAIVWSLGLTFTITFTITRTLAFTFMMTDVRADAVHAHGHVNIQSATQLRGSVFARIF